MPGLVVFDIDGTLIDSTAVDTDSCFFPALRFSLGLAGFGDDWETYDVVTSAGVFAEIVRRAHGRPPAPGETALMQEKLDTLMRREFLGAGTRIPPIPGAPELVVRLKADPAWRVAVATGNWRNEAAVKIESVGLPLADVPTATSDDHAVRSDILALAVQRASQAYRVAAWERVIYVGDRPWDVRAARTCGFAFVGVGSGTRAAALHAAGSGSVTRDLTDPDRMLELLAAATPPRPEAGTSAA